MRELAAFLLVLLTLSGCKPKESSIDPDRLGGIELAAASSDAKRYFGNGAKVVAICGPSVGARLQLESKEAVLTQDEISGGVIALGFDANGQPDVVHRDAMKQMIRVSEDLGVVTFLPRPNGKNLGTWKIDFPTTGIVETHSLMTAPDGGLVDIWTSTRSDGLLPARGLVLLSKCEAI